MSPEPRRGWLEGWLHGARFPARGLKTLAASPELLPWAVAPVLVALALLVAAGLLTIQGTPALVHWLFPVAPTPLLGALRTAFTLTLGLFLFVAAALALYASVGVVGTPFYDRLSQAVEDRARGGPDEPFSWGVFARDVARSAWHSVLSLFLWLTVLLLLGVLSLVPVVGSLVEFVLSLFTTALFVSREMMDGTLSRRRMSYLDKLRFMRVHRAEVLGFGAVSALCLAIPLVNLVALPVCIAGGTLLVLDLEGRRVH